MKNWIQEAEAEAKGTRKSGPSGTVPRVYDTRLVAWIDILGMRNKMRTEENAEDVFICMEKMQDFVDEACSSLAKEGRLSFLQISDGFVIIADIEVINEFCSILCAIQWRVLVHLRMLVRGAMTAGKVSISDDSRLIVGPGFIEAFALEAENAIYPRILFSNDVVKHMKAANLTFNHLKQDSDAFLYLDFMQHMIDTKKIIKKNLIHLMETEGVIRFLTDEYNAYIDKNKKLAQKYGWMISRFADQGIKIKVEGWRE